MEEIILTQKMLIAEAEKVFIGGFPLASLSTALTNRRARTVRALRLTVQ